MQVRLPVVVIGGGLTAIDTATESLAYYPLQVEKFLARYETLAAERGEAAVARRVDGRGDGDRRRVPRARTRDPRRARGGRARRSRRTHRRTGAVVGRRHGRLSPPTGRQPVLHAEPRGGGEGAGGGHPLRGRADAVAVHVDEHNRACALEVSVQHNDGDGVWHETGRASLPARTILVAAGTQPNTVLAREDADHFHVDGKYFRLLDEYGAPLHPVRGLAKPEVPAVLTELRADGRAVSFFGDLHPSWAGNVVKAMGSAKLGYPIVSRVLGRTAPASTASDAEFIGKLDRELPCHGRAGRAADADDRRGRGARARRRAPLPARAVLPAAELRVARRDGGRHAARDGGPGAHRRVGRPRAGPRVDDRARDGRLVRPLRAA